MSVAPLPLNFDPENFLNDNIANLSDGDLVNYFYCRDTVNYTKLPEPTPDQLKTANDILHNRFTYTGETFQFDANFSWRPNPSTDKEWQIAFHKHYFLIDLIQAYKQSGEAIYLEKWKELLNSWIDDMGSGFITLSDAQVEAKRMESWCISFMLLKGASWPDHIDCHFLRRFLQRINDETFYITQHLKRVRNHRTFQLYAIFLVGVLFPELKQQPFFISTGKDLLTENLLTDFHRDGVHIEMSTHYHQLVAETGMSMLEMARLNHIPVSNELEDRLHRALRFSLFMQWPDGNIPLINDSDNGNHFDLLDSGNRYFNDPELLWGASLGNEGKAPDSASQAFPESGYFILGNTWGFNSETYLNRQHTFYDCGKLGEGSHSHYDLFNFCYFVNGKPAILDPGRYSYSGEPDAEGILWRHYFKGTAAHNTVLIDGLDQTTYLNRTKHGPEVILVDRDFALGKKIDWVFGRAISENYSPRHERWFVYMGHEYLFILDNLLSNDNCIHSYELNFHLSDGIDANLKGHHDCHHLISDRCDIYTIANENAESKLKPGWISRYYGIKHEAPIFSIKKNCLGDNHFASIINPPDSASFAVKKFLALRGDNQESIYTVEYCQHSQLFQDFYIATGSNGIYQTDTLLFKGRLLAYRMNNAGDIIFLSAVAATEIVLCGKFLHQSTSVGNFEWQQ